MLVELEHVGTEARNLPAVRQRQTPDGALSSLGALLLSQAEATPDIAAYTFLYGPEHTPPSLTYAEFAARAGAMAAYLVDRGCQGRPVLILLPSGLDFATVLFGCFLAGAIAVPAPQPTGTRGLGRIRSIVKDCTPQLVIASVPMPERGEPLPHVDWVVLGDIKADVDRGVPFLAPTSSASDPAVLQYTSGSTGDPKGVVITHRNAIENVRQLEHALGLPRGSQFVSWLPVHHDMGLFASIILAPLSGGHLAFMPPAAFVQTPSRWLKAISEFRAVISGAPDFAYDLCTRRVSAEDRADLDLSCWTIAYSGSEPVRAPTLRKFVSAFAPYGFTARALRPSYGLAEATLLATTQKPVQTLDVRRYDRDELFAGSAKPAPDGEAVTSCGVAGPGGSVAIVDPGTGKRVAERVLGEIWFAGQNVSSGYWNRIEQSAQRFGGRLESDQKRWLRTGDLGFLDDGQLFVLSRLDDLIILRGRNVPPDDVELAAQVSTAQVPNAAVAFAAPDGGSVVVVQELERGHKADYGALAAQVRSAVASATDTAVSRVVFVRLSAIPRTTSGKVRRKETATLLAAGELAVLHDDLSGASDIETGSRPEAALGNSGLDLLRVRLGEVLRLSGPAPADASFTSLGLDSLRAAEIAQWVHDTFQISPPLSAFLGDQTAQDIAALIGGRNPVLKRDLGGADQPAVPARIPLTRGQRALWVAQMQAPRHAGNHLSLGILLARIEPDQLRDAVRHTALRHGMLRSTFVVDDGVPRRIVHPDCPIVVGERDVGSLQHAERDAAIEAFVREPFQLVGGVPWRACLFRDGSGGTLAFVFHHILCDGWSLTAFAREMTEALADRVGEPVAMPSGPAADAFTEALGEEEAFFCTPEARLSLAFFADRLADGPGPLPLASSKPAPASGMTVRSLPLSAEQLDALNRHAAIHGATAARFLFGLFATALGRLTSRDDLVITVIASVRPLPHHADTFGYFANPLPVRVHLPLSRGVTVSASAAAAADQLAETLDHRLAPFTEIVQAAGMADSAEDLFQVVFNHVRSEDSIWADESCARAAGDSQPKAFLLRPQEGTAALALSFVESATGCRLYLTCDPDRVAPEIAELLPALLDRLVASDPDAPLAAVPLADSATLDKIRTWANSPRARSAPAADGVPLMRLFAESAARHAGRIAVKSDAVAWTYAELANRAAAVATMLQGQGVGPGSIVALRMSSRPEWIAGMLGTLTTGAAFLTLDPDQPEARNQALLEASGARSVLSAADVAAAGVAPARPFAEMITAAQIAEQSPAYLIYTSGSTGVPKGVLVPQDALRERLLWKVDALAIGRRDRILQSIQITFDPAIWEALAPLLAGATIVHAGPEVRRQPHLMADMIADERITIFSCVSSMVPHLEPLIAGRRRRTLRSVVVGGEPLSGTVADTFVRRTGARIDHFYGPTEATIYCTHERVDRSGHPERESIIPIGRPVAGAVVSVADPVGAPCPPGVIGEIVIGGRGLALGYLPLAAGSSAFVETPEGRIYRSGDLGRWRADGRLEVLGRRDAQVKIRGVRIEVAEVEAAVLAHPEVRDVAVVVRKENGDAQLRAYVVCGPEPVDSLQIRQELAGRLPPAMVPAVIQTIPALPRLPSGKVDRGALAAIRVDPSCAEERSAAEPETPLEAVLLRHWCALLGRTDIGLTDDLYANGAHSLLALRVAGRVEYESGQTITVDNLLRHRTVRDQAAAVVAPPDSTRNAQPVLERLSSETGGPALLCIAPGIGDRVRMQALADAMGADATIWTILPPSFMPSGPWPLSRLMDAYHALVRDQFGDRLPILAGFSVGGVMVVELAARLEKAGLGTAPLILLDTAFPVLMGLSVRTHATLRRLVRLAWRGEERNSPFCQQLRRHFLDDGLSTHLRAAVETGKRFGGPAVIVRGYPSRLISPLMFAPWRSRTASIQYVDTTGFHGEMFKPRHVGRLAAAVRQAMSHWS